MPHGTSCMEPIEALGSRVSAPKKSWDHVPGRTANLPKGRDDSGVSAAPRKDGDGNAAEQHSHGWKQDKPTDEAKLVCWRKRHRMWLENGTCSRRDKTFSTEGQPHLGVRATQEAEEKETNCKDEQDRVQRSAKGTLPHASRGERDPSAERKAQGQAEAAACTGGHPKVPADPQEAARVTPPPR